MSLTGRFPPRNAARNRRASNSTVARRTGRPRRVRARRRSGSAERGEPRRDAERQLDRQADVQLRVRAAVHQVLVEEVLEVEPSDEGVTLDAPVGAIATGDSRALAMLEFADAARGERAAIERGRELLADGV